MRLRRWLTRTAVGASFVLAAALPVDLVSQSTGRIASVFLGLFAASILPTVSLLLQSMTSATRSVNRVDALYHEIRAAVDALFRILGIAGVATVALLLNSVRTPEALTVLNNFDSLERIGNGIAGGAIVLLIAEAGKIPSIIRRSLKIRYEVARDEAKNRTSKNVPTEKEIRSYFPTKEGFGETRPLEELGKA